MHQAIQNTLSISLESKVTPESIIKFDPFDLENELKKLLEKVKRGEAISYKKTNRLKEIKRYLQLLNVAPAVLERLNQLIDEILTINDELIYPDDGSWRTDQETGPGD